MVVEIHLEIQNLTQCLQGVDKFAQLEQLALLAQLERVALLAQHLQGVDQFAQIEQLALIAQLERVALLAHLERVAQHLQGVVDQSEDMKSCLPVAG